MSTREDLQAALDAARVTAEAERDRDRGLYLDGVAEGLQRALWIVAREVVR